MSASKDSSSMTACIWYNLNLCASLCVLPIEQFDPFYHQDNINLLCGLFFIEINQWLSWFDLESTILSNVLNDSLPSSFFSYLRCFQTSNSASNDFPDLDQHLKFLPIKTISRIRLFFSHILPQKYM